MENLPLLEFRDGVSGRRAGVRGGPDVWEVVMVVRGCDGDLGRTEDHFGGFVAKEAIAQALSYAEQFAEAVEEQIRDNERVEQLLGGR